MGGRELQRLRLIRQLTTADKLFTHLAYLVLFSLSSFLTEVNRVRLLLVKGVYRPEHSHLCRRISKRSYSLGLLQCVLILS